MSPAQSCLVVAVIVVVAVLAAKSQPTAEMQGVVEPTNRFTVPANVSDTMLLMLNAIAYQESGGRADAHNKPEQSVGILQIRPILVRDLWLTKYNGRKFTLLDRWNPEASAMMFMAYQHMYLRDLRSAMTQREYMARIWNGGPRGWTKEATKKYWRGVQRYIEKLETGKLPMIFVRRA